jgi:TPR repeat protein
MTIIQSASAQTVKASADLADGVNAFRAGDYINAWRVLQPIAASGDAKAQRYAGKILITADLPDQIAGDERAGVAYLTRAALAGDYAALVELENLRLAGKEFAPTLDDMIALETARAEAGDPVTAWRLSRRFETGEGVEPSEAERLKWLEVAAMAGEKWFPKASEAAFLLCEAHALGANDARAAQNWCGKAADSGHAGAAILLRRLAKAQG